MDKLRQVSKTTLYLKEKTPEKQTFVPPEVLVRDMQETLGQFVSGSKDDPNASNTARLIVGVHHSAEKARGSIYYNVMQELIDSLKEGTTIDYISRMDSYNKKCWRETIDTAGTNRVSHEDRKALLTAFDAVNAKDQTVDKQ